MSDDVRIIREYREMTRDQRAVAAREFADILAMIPFDDLAGISPAHLAMAFEVLDDMDRGG